MATAEPKGRIADFPVGFHAKIGRAKEHLDALKTSIAPFTAEGKAYTIVKEVDRDGLVPVKWRLPSVKV